MKNTESKLEDLLKVQKEETEKTRAWIASVLDRRSFDLATDALEETMLKLRAKGCDRDSFIIAAFLATISIDMSEEVTPERFLTLLRKFVICGETVIRKHVENAASAVAAAGGAQA